MHDMMTRVHNTVKFVKRVQLKCSQQKKKRKRNNAGDKCVN